MKFVHLAPQPALSQIRRSGIRMGDGRRGRGVYAVPLLMIPRSSPRNQQEDVAVKSGPLTSSTLWKWLLRKNRSNARAAAVVFELPDSHWPIDIYITVSPTMTGLLPALESSNTDHYYIPADDIAFVHDAFRQGFYCDLHVVALTSTGVGLVFKYYQQAGAIPWSNNDDTIETVIRLPISRSAIHRIKPLYRTNKEFKARKHR